MSNSLAIATVTAALRESLQDAVGTAVSGATVSFSRPDSSNAAQPAAVSIYLYQVTPNAAYRNADLPTRRSEGAIAQRPQAAFDLHYLFTFHGNDDQLEPQLLLGAVASTLHAHPFLSQAAIDKAKSDLAFLSQSNVEQVERIKFTPMALSLEEFSKLWSVFFQVEYRLSAAYQASVVLIESADQAISTLPVRARNLSVVPLRFPQIERVVSQAGADSPIVSGVTLLIQGQQLKGEVTVVRMEGQELTPTQVTDTQLALPLPPPLPFVIHAGAKTLQVLRKVKTGAPPVAQLAAESNVAQFVVRPTITRAVATGPVAGVTTVTLDITPNIGKDQRAFAIVNSVSLTTPTTATSETITATADSNQVTVTFLNVATGNYVIRVQIDGAESLLGVDGSGHFASPPVPMP